MSTLGLHNLITITPSQIPTPVPTTFAVIDTLSLILPAPMASTVIDTLSPILIPLEPMASTVIDTLPPIPLTTLSVMSLKPTPATVTPGDKTTVEITGIVTPVGSVKTVTASVDPHNFNDRPNLGTIIGIVIGIVVVFLVLTGGILFFFLKRRGLLNAQSSASGNRGDGDVDAAESSSSFSEGIGNQSSVLSMSEITNSITITGTTPSSNPISDTTASSTPSSSPYRLLHDSTSDDTLARVPRVPQLLTAGSNLDSEFESFTTGRSGEGIIPDSGEAVQTLVPVSTAPTPNQLSLPNANSSLNYNVTLPHHSDERWHTDSGIRVGGGTLLAYEYGDDSSYESSIRSKDRFPPPCVREQ